MTGTYQRPTVTVDLPSGKKVVIAEYFTAYEMEEIQTEMSKGVTVSRKQMEAASEGTDEEKAIAKDKLDDTQIPMENLLNSYRKARSLSLRKLIGEDGTEYEPTEENVREFFTAEDGECLNAKVTEMINGKKKLTSGQS